MTETVTITHHATKPEYQWEFVFPEGPTVLLRQEVLTQALNLLGLQDGNDATNQIQALPNGGSQSVNADLEKHLTDQLVALGVKSV